MFLFCVAAGARVNKVHDVNHAVCVVRMYSLRLKMVCEFSHLHVMFYKWSIGCWTRKHIFDMKYVCGWNHALNGNM